MKGGGGVVLVERFGRLLMQLDCGCSGVDIDYSGVCENL